MLTAADTDESPGTVALARSTGPEFYYIFFKSSTGYMLQFEHVLFLPTGTIKTIMFEVRLNLHKNMNKMTSQPFLVPRHHKRVGCRG